MLIQSSPTILVTVPSLARKIARSARLELGFTNRLMSFINGLVTFTNGALIYLRGIQRAPFDPKTIQDDLQTSQNNFPTSLGNFTPSSNNTTTLSSPSGNGRKMMPPNYIVTPFILPFPELVRRVKIPIRM